MSPPGHPKGGRPRSAGRRAAPGVPVFRSSGRRLAFARARTPVAVAMRIVAEALATPDRDGGARRSVFIGARGPRRVALRDPAGPPVARPPRGCEDLH